MSLKHHPAVFLYISCSLTKRAGVGEHLELGPTAWPQRGDPLVEVMTRWQRTVDRTPATSRVRAIDLYGGGVWGDLRRNYPELHAQGVEIRIVSAGMGLLAAEDKVPAYDATFAPGAKNAIGGVHGAVDRNRSWWHLLGQWPNRSGPQTIYATVKRHPQAAHLIALPSDYLEAVLDDVEAIVQDKDSRDRLVVLSSPYTSARGLIPRTVDVPGDLYGAFGGTRGTVLARAGLFIAPRLKERAADPEAVKSALKPLHARAKPLPVRKVQSDGKVLQFLQQALRQNATLSHSALLVRFREAGYACERRRFKNLHQKAQSSL